MPTKKKAGGRKRGDEADRAELEMLRKQVEEQRQALEAEEARKEQENQGKRQVSSRRQRTLVRWDGKSFFFHLSVWRIHRGCCHIREHPWTDRLLLHGLAFKYIIFT